MARSARGTLLPYCGMVLAAVLVGIGCAPEMPAPPPKVFGHSAEEDFDWAMERMKHAIERFRPASSLGLSVKRELNYELIPPAEKQDKYRARVTISTRTVFRHVPSQTEAQKRRAEAKKNAAKVKLDNPYQLPGGQAAADDGFPLPDVPVAEISDPEIADPRVPTQQLVEKREYLLEYVDGQWRLTSDDVEEHEKLWFAYALEQGEFAPGASANR